VNAGPISPDERIEFIDVLRGFALFGILLENVQFFVRPSYGVLFATQGAGSIDWLGIWLVDFIAVGKFYPIFSLLFGYGIALQMVSAVARGDRFLPFISWRLLLLMLIGLYHQTYLWDGDILATYALLAFVLLPFRNASDRLLLAVGALCLLAWPLFHALLRGGLDLGLFAAGAAERIEALFAEFTNTERPAARQTFRILAMLFLGFTAGRRNLFGPAAIGTRDLGRAAKICLAGGALGNLLYLAYRTRLDPAALSWGWVFAVALFTVATLIMAAGYVGALVDLSSRPHWRRRLSPLALVGRMSLSNYLTQTLCLLAIVAAFRWIDLGPIWPLGGIAIAVGLFGAQVAASRWWLRRYQFGPAEWVWRSMAYGRRLPMRARAGKR